jgi:predicted O-linked N-acetylglucosamine transferase (SPINDLY family)
LGATYIDYIIADECVLPESHRIFYNEKVVYLPNCYQANDHKKKIGSHIFSRLECGLPEVGFVFCCFNKSYKITPDTFDCWIRILKQVVGSVLWPFDFNLSAPRNLKRRIENKGINPDRLVFSKPLPLPDHLARLAVADLCLDTLPYNAHTTASDALWVGLPILTQIGTTFAARVAASLLNAIGLPELVTSTEQAFEALAVELANNPDKLKDLRQMLSSRRYSAPLFDTQLFTHNIEKAYCAMNDRFQTGLPPDHIRVFQ